MHNTLIQTVEAINFAENTEADIIIKVKEIIMLKLIILVNKNAKISHYLLKYINSFLLKNNTLNAQKNNLQKRNITL